MAEVTVTKKDLDNFGALRMKLVVLTPEQLADVDAKIAVLNFESAVDQLKAAHEAAGDVVVSGVSAEEKKDFDDAMEALNVLIQQDQTADQTFATAMAAIGAFGTVAGHA
jgi:hypothetical protein